MPKKSAIDDDMEEGSSLACPKCGSEILDMNKAPEAVRCIVCKNIFKQESKDKRRRGKGVPHRIRKKSKLMSLFTKVESYDEVVEKEEDGEEKEEVEEEFKSLRSKEERTRMTVVITSLVLMMIFFALAVSGLRIIFSESTKEIELREDNVHIEKYYVQLDWLAFTMLGLMLGFGPIGIYEGSRNNRIVKLEERLADFLRDLAESSRSGQTLHEAINTASNGEYGELLPYIRQMSVQVSWGVSANEALIRFSERVNTPLVKRAVTLINEASSAGGDVSKVLEAAANDTKELQMLFRERKIQMSLYVAVIFVSFVVFLVVILIVYATFVPQMKANAIQQEAQNAEDDEDASGTSSAGGDVGASFSPVGVDFVEIKLIFVYAALVHAVGDGLVAGLMGSGKIMDGLKLSFIMIMIVFVIFIFVMPGLAIG